MKINQIKNICNLFMKKQLSVNVKPLRNSGWVNKNGNEFTLVRFLLEYPDDNVTSIFVFFFFNTTFTYHALILCFTPQMALLWFFSYRARLLLRPGFELTSVQLHLLWGIYFRMLYRLSDQILYWVFFISSLKLALCSVTWKQLRRRLDPALYRNDLCQGSL